MIDLLKINYKDAKELFEIKLCGLKSNEQFDFSPYKYDSFFKIKNHIICINNEHIRFTNNEDFFYFGISDNPRFIPAIELVEDLNNLINNYIVEKEKEKLEEELPINNNNKEKRVKI